MIDLKPNCFLEIMGFMVNDLSVYILFNNIYDFVEQAFYRCLLAVDCHNADSGSLPFILILELGKGDIVIFRQTALESR